jgi:peptidoglycan/LPS O-acetylase OafA/YrhL
MNQNYGSDARQMFSNASLWSLPVELELYAVYPLFYWLLMCFGVKRAMFVVGVVSLSSLGLLLKDNLFDHNGYQVGNFAIYWIIWCGGALLAEWVKRDQLPKWRPWLWLVMASTFIMAMGVYFLKLFIGLQDLIWGGFYFMVLLWSFTRKNPLQFLNNRMKNIFLSLGLISYSLYLIHYPFFRLCGAMWVDIVGTKPTNFLIPVFFSILSIPLAYAFYSCFEAPTHRLARKVASRISS